MTKITARILPAETVLQIVQAIANAITAAGDDGQPDMQIVHDLVSSLRTSVDGKSLTFLHQRVDELDRNLISVLLQDAKVDDPDTIFDALLTTRQRDPDVMSGLIQRRQAVAQKHFSNIKRENLNLAFGIYKNGAGGEMVDLASNIQGVPLIPITYQQLGDDALTDKSQKSRVDTTAVPRDIASQMKMQLLQRSVQTYKLMPVSKAGQFVNYPNALVMSDMPVNTPYDPKRWKNAFDPNIIRVVNNYRALFGVDRARLFDDIVEYYQYGNGSIFGQIGRNTAVIATQVDIVRNQDSYLNYDNLRVNPCGFVDDGFTRRYETPADGLKIPSFTGKDDPQTGDFAGWVQSFQSQFTYFDGSGEERSALLTPTNMKSSTGLYCGSATEKNYSIEEKNPGTIFAVAQQFLSQVVQQPQAKRYQYVQSHPVMYSPIKPKGELTTNADALRKTRNIVAASAPSQKLAQPFVNAFFGNRVNFDFNRDFVFSTDAQPTSTQNLNLTGMSFSNDACSIMVKRMKESEDGQYILLFMSDNLFMCCKHEGKVHWASFDVSKMEGSHDERDIKDIIKMIYTPYQTDPSDADYIDSLQKITLIQSINTPGVLGNSVMKIPYLSSGCVGTSYFNSWKMSKAVAILQRAINRTPFSQSSEQAFLKHFSDLVDISSFQLLQDMLSGGTAIDVFKFFGMKLEKVLYCRDVIDELETNRIVELDLLGFGLVKPDIHTDNGVFDDFYLPTLSSERIESPNYVFRDTADRLAKAVITTKSRDEDSGMLRKKDIQLLTGQIAKYLCMFYLGAWFRDDMRKIVFAALVQVSVQLQPHKYMRQIASELTSLLDDIDGVDFSGLKLPLSPSFQDLVQIYAPNRVADYMKHADQELVQTAYTPLSFSPAGGEYLQQILDHVSLIPELTSVPVQDGMNPTSAVLPTASSLKAKMENFFTRDMQKNGTARVIPIDDTLYIDLLEKERVKFIVDHQLFFHQLISEVPNDVLRRNDEIEKEIRSLGYLDPMMMKAWRDVTGTFFDGTYSGYGKTSYLLQKAVRNFDALPKSFKPAKSDEDALAYELEDIHRQTAPPNLVDARIQPLPDQKGNINEYALYFRPRALEARDQLVDWFLKQYDKWIDKGKKKSNIKYRSGDNQQLFKSICYKTKIRTGIVQWLDDVYRTLVRTQWSSTISSESLTPPYRLADGGFKNRSAYTFQKRQMLITYPDGKSENVQIPVNGLILMEAFKEMMRRAMKMTKGAFREVGGPRLAQEVFAIGNQLFILDVRAKSKALIGAFLDRRGASSDMTLIDQLAELVRQGDPIAVLTRVANYFRVTGLGAVDVPSAPYQTLVELAKTIQKKVIDVHAATRSKHDYSRLLRQIIEFVKETLDVSYMQPAPLLDALLSTLRYERRLFAYTTQPLMCDATAQRFEAAVRFAEAVGVPPLFMTSAVSLASAVGILPIFGGGYVQYVEKGVQVRTSVPKNSEAFYKSRLLTNSGFFRVLKSVKNIPKNKLLFFDSKEDLMAYFDKAKVSNDLEQHLRLIQTTSDLKMKLALLGQILSPLMGRTKASSAKGVYNAVQMRKDPNVEALGPWHNVVVLSDCSFMPDLSQTPSYYDIALGVHDPDKAMYRSLSATWKAAGLPEASVQPDALMEAGQYVCDVYRASFISTPTTLHGMALMPSFATGKLSVPYVAEFEFKRYTDHMIYLTSELFFGTITKGDEKKYGCNVSYDALLQIPRSPDPTTQLHWCAAHTVGRALSGISTVILLEAAYTGVYNRDIVQAAIDTLGGNGDPALRKYVLTTILV